jgi:hypothetical protein
MSSSLFYVDQVKASNIIVPVNESSDYYESLIKSIEFSKVKEHVSFLSSLESRATGTPGNKLAAQYINSKFLEYGLNVTDPFGLNEFFVAEAIDHGANITIDGNVIRIYPCIPNLVSTSTTPPEGITGTLIYAGQGYYEDFNGKEVKDSIVLLDWQSSNRWIYAAKLGAKAVIFLPTTPYTQTLSLFGSMDLLKLKGTSDIMAGGSGGQSAFQSSLKWLRDMPFTFPRFIVNETNAEILMENLNKPANLKSSQIWENTPTWNILGLVRGTSTPENYIMISAYYDSYSDSPSWAPGAQEACGISSLLELARIMAKNPPENSVLFVALGAHHQWLSGMRSFLYEYLVGPDPYQGPERDKGLSWISPELGNTTQRQLGLWRVGNDNVRAIKLNIQLDMSTGDDAIYISERDGRAISNPGWVVEYTDRINVANILLPLVENINNMRPGGKTYEVNYDSWFLPVTPLSKQYKYLPWKAWDTDHEVLCSYGTVGFTVFTAYDMRPFYREPFDTIDKVNYENLQKQLEISYLLVDKLTNLDNPSSLTSYSVTGLTASGFYRALSCIRGQVAEWDPENTWYKPISNALVHMELYSEPNARFTLMTNEKGEFVIFPLDVETLPDLSAWKVNGTTGTIYVAPDYGTHQFAPKINTLNMAADNTNIGYIAVFNCSTIVLFDVLKPDVATAPIYNRKQVSPQVSVMEHEAHVDLESRGYYIYGSPSRNELSEPSILTVTFPPNSPIEIIWKYQRDRYPVAFLVNSSITNPTGTGYTLSLGKQLILPFTSLMYAETFNNINLDRMKDAEKIEPWIFQGTPLYQNIKGAEALINEAYDAISNFQYDKAFSLAYESWDLSRSVYLTLRMRIEDAVFVVPFIAIFFVPFVFLTERLIFNFEGKKRLAIYICLFSSLLAAFYGLHPGFIFAANASMIILGISILALTGPSIVVMFNYLFSYISDLRVERLGVHEIHVRRLGEVAHSLSTGIRNMKRLKFRTTLTLISIMLIVWAIVSLTSVSSAGIIKFSPFPMGSPSYNGIYIHRDEWGGYPQGFYGISDEIVTILRTSFGEQAEISPRSWRYHGYPDNYEEPNPLTVGFTLKHGVNQTNAPILWGISPEEKGFFSHLLVAGNWLLPSDRNVAIITEQQSRKLGIAYTDLPVNITISQVPYKVVGIISANVSRLLDLDGQAVTPLKLDIDPRFQLYADHVDAEYCVIIPYKEVCDIWGGKIGSISIRTENKSLIPIMGEQIFDLFPGLSIWENIDKNILFLSASRTFSAFGWEFQIIPIALAMLSVFNILLGTVYERKSSISTYSSLGLSPIHVIFMFLTETVIYAVLGGVSGYLLALLVGRTSNVIIPGLVFLNFSSQFVIIALGSSMLIIVLSSIYPIFIAGRLVTPSLERTWHIPTAPVGDIWEVPLPFVVSSEKEAKGILAYLHEYMKAHASSDAPDFSVMDLQLATGTKDGRPFKHMKVDLRLVPYEVGLIQHLDLVIQKMEERWEFSLGIKRIQGPSDSWVHLNHNFIDTIRKQLLLWRGIKDTEKERYMEAKINGG